MEKLYITMVGVVMRFPSLHTQDNILWVQNCSVGPPTCETISPFQACKIEWFPRQPIMQFLRMGTYLQNVHISAVTHPRMLI